MSALDPRALRHAFGAYPTGVTVVTARAEDGSPVGFTANSFTSVSLAPPLLLVCPGRFLTSFPVFESCDRFAINVLAEGQEEISDIFARFAGDRFAEIGWTDDGLSPPLLDGVAAHFVCDTHKVVPAGDHVLLMGEVESFADAGRDGLGYLRGRYFSHGAGPVDAGRRQVG